MTEFSNSTKTNLHEFYENYMLGGRSFPRMSSGMFRPSEASVLMPTSAGMIPAGGCPRKTWYRLKGIPKTDETFLSHQIMRMEVGKQVERSCIEDFKRMGIFVDNNVKFKSTMMGVDISGEVDAILRTEPCSGTKYALEIKSIYGRFAQTEQFGNFLFPRAGYAKPKWGHLLQLGIYLYHYSLLPEDHPGYLPFGSILYVDRGDGHFGSFDVELVKEYRILEEGSVPVHKIAYWSKMMKVPYTITDFAIEDCIGRFGMIKSYLNKEEPPPREYKLVFTPEEIEKRHDAGLISDSKYNSWKKSHAPRGKKKVKLGDWICLPLYCGWSSLCNCCEK